MNASAASQARPIVVKIGGSTLGTHDTSLQDCAALHMSGRPVVLVHGGGAAVTEWLTRLAVPTEFVDGLRKTTHASLEVVVAVLAGLVNKILVQKLAAAGVRAVGVSGVDGGLLRSPVNDRGLGLVGDAPTCDPAALSALLEAGLLPVVAPVGLTPAGDAILNINADTAAGAIAAALGAEQLIFLTDVQGVLDGSGNVLASLDRTVVARLRTDGTIGAGMIPKVEACLTAASAGAQAKIVDGRGAGAVPAALTGTVGTQVRCS